MSYFPPEALALLVTILLGPSLMAFHILIFRRRDENTPGHVHLFIAFGVFLATVFLAVFVVSGFSITLRQILAAGGTAGFGCLAYMQVFSQVCRGFSLRILVDVDRCDQLDLDGILREYSDGQGAAFLLNKRIAVMEEQGMLRQVDDTIVLARPKGETLGKLGILIKRILKPGQGG